MIALLLAAGFGTRLKPYSLTLPKPLFTIAGKTLLEKNINYLIEAGITKILINTHYLSDQIHTFLARNAFPVPIYVFYEPVMRGTGGAVKNVLKYWDHGPLLIINADISTDIDLQAVIRFHKAHSEPATLVMHDYPEFNTVRVSSDHRILGFHSKDTVHDEACILAFTGIQVIEKQCADHMPDTECFSSIDVYQAMIESGLTVQALIVHNTDWCDIGTPARFRDANFSAMAKKALAGDTVYRVDPLLGDGSDRKWFRVIRENNTVIVADHGIHPPGKNTREVDAFISIGRHLSNHNLPVPGIIAADPLSGLVFLEDMGDTHLLDHVRMLSTEDRHHIYETVIGQLVRLFINGAKEFNPAWTYQTARYNEALVYQKECLYFYEMFLNGYMNMKVPLDELDAEFIDLSHAAPQFPLSGLIHRDFQSKNIMIWNNAPYFIDFQGARTGPPGYDLASLLIDPYVSLPEAVQDRLLNHYIRQLDAIVAVDPQAFLNHYALCRITRNLQILGAFSNLSLNKGKTAFKRYIPAAAISLKTNLRPLASRFPRLSHTVRHL